MLLHFLLACGWMTEPPPEEVLPPPCVVQTTRTGRASFYDFADGSGNCSFPATPGDPLVAALNTVDYAQGAACGRCAEVTGPNGSVIVRIVDRCPGCKKGGLDLHPDAFARIAPLSDGRVDITWSFTPCDDVLGPVTYHFEGANDAVQVRNHRTGIATFEVLEEGEFREVRRVSHNYFVDPRGIGEGPFVFRLTDVHGRMIQDVAIAPQEDEVVDGVGQFPDCP